MKDFSFLLLLAVVNCSAFAADWSETEVQILKGDKYHDAGNDKDIRKTIVTLQHASSYKFGRNYFFVDSLKSHYGDQDYGEIYGEFYSTLSYTKITLEDLSKSFVRDVGLTGGINYGAKNSAFGPNPQVYLIGTSFDFFVPGFLFFTVNTLAYIDNSQYSGFGGGYSCGKNSTTYQITPTWALPFSIGNHRLSFEGFLDYIGKHGSCSEQIITQPQLRVDVGNYFGKKDTVFIGFEYQYWKNKFGLKGRTDSFPQALLTWKL